MLPPAVVYGPDGKPWHSWRILICPFLGETATFEKYRFDEPWDGPNNIKLLQDIPRRFQDITAAGYRTRYVVVTGEQTFFPAIGVRMTNRSQDPLAASSLSMNTATPGVRRFAEVRDVANTIMTGISHRGDSVPWTKPVDLRFEKVIGAIGKSGGFATDDDGAQFLFGNGSIRLLSMDEMEAKLKAFLSINGRELAK
jgi:hypothetical protein